MRMSADHCSLSIRSTTLEAHIYSLSAAMIFLSFTLSSPVLNLVMPYTMPGGSFFAKFHPASWLSGPLLLLVWLHRNVKTAPLPRHLAWATAIMASLVTWLAVREKGQLAATFIDIHLAPLVLLLALSCLPMARLRELVRTFVAVAAINVLLVVTEFALQARLFVHDEYQEFFRPTGLFGHPIIAGTLFNCALLLVSRGIVARSSTRPLILFFLVGVALCGVRGPLAMAAFIFLAHVINPVFPRRSIFDYLADFGLIALLPVGILAALAAGAFDRILALGIWDQSAQSRFYIFNALGRLSEDQFWKGIDNYDFMIFLAEQTANVQHIENALVSTTLYAGFPAAVVLGICLLILHGPTMRLSLTFAVLVALVATTTQGFGVKNMIALAIALTGYFVWRQAKEHQH